MKIFKYIFLLGLMTLIFTGCSSEKKEEKENIPEDLIHVKKSMLLEVSLLGEHKHITIRTIDEEVIKLNVTWEEMPNVRVGSQIGSLSYTEKDKTLYSIVK